MKFGRIAGLLFALSCSVLAVPNVHAKLIPSPDGLTVYDTLLQVNWLANANLAGTADGQQFRARVPDISISQFGSMDYSAAKAWVNTLNGNDAKGNPNGTAPLLGHNTWSLPTSPWAFPNPPLLPPYDPTCSQPRGPNDASFGFGCRNSAMGSLYNRKRSLHLRHPNTAVPIPYNTVGPFANFQPYLYWSGTPSGNNDNGYQTFSFNTGWEGSNVDGHYMYVLPMIVGKPCTVIELPRLHISCPKYFPTGVGSLELSEDGQTVYDPGAPGFDPVTGIPGVTWLADANLAATQKFGAQCVNKDGTKCIDRDGSMTHTTALNWIAGMNAAAWMGQTSWQLPPTDANDNCGILLPVGLNAIPNFNCTGSPMGELFYDQLKLSQGTPVVPTPDIDVGPFNHLQPYLYWSCTAAQPPASQTLCDYANPPNTGFAYSFSFGNGFQGTDVVGNNLYVMVYYPETPAAALDEAITAALGVNPQLEASFQSQAAAIASAPNAKVKTQALGSFAALVEGQRGVALTAAQADYLIALAQAI